MPSPARAIITAFFRCSQHWRLPGSRGSRIFGCHSFVQAGSCRPCCCWVWGLGVVAEIYSTLEQDPFRVVMGLQTEESYLSQELGWYAPAINTVNKLPQSAAVQFLWEPRTYYCQRDCRSDAILDRWWYLRRSIGTSDEIADYLRAQGVTHILIYDFGAELEAVHQPLLRESDWVELERFKQNELKLFQDFDGIYSIYGLTG